VDFYVPRLVAFGFCLVVFFVGMRFKRREQARRKQRFAARLERQSKELRIARYIELQSFPRRQEQILPVRKEQSEKTSELGSFEDEPTGQTYRN
jgi:hypothetical protein